jgi:hypothetical protein
MIPVKRKSERDDASDDSEEDDENTEEIIKKLQKNTSKKFFRNIDDESEIEQLEADVIFVISPPATISQPVAQPPSSLQHQQPFGHTLPTPPLIKRIGMIMGAFMIIMINYVYMYLFIYFITLLTFYYYLRFFLFLLLLFVCCLLYPRICT